MKDYISVVNEANMRARLSRPLTPEGKYLTLYKPAERFLHCCIESIGCRYNRDNGACIMCDYGKGRNLSKQELTDALNIRLSPFWGHIDTLLLGSYGSILDESEISDECFKAIISVISDKPVSTVIFETHCSTVTEEKLSYIKGHLPDSISIVIEMGFESSDPYVLKTCLNKNLDLDQLRHAITLIHEYSMEACLNVFLGAPFLNPSDQLDTAVRSVLWANEQGADSVVIFPANIKPFTLLHGLYQKRLYKPVSQWMLIELLRRIPGNLLANTTFAWYGDRKNFYENDEYPLVPPVDCDICHDMILNFYHDYMKEKQPEKRSLLLSNLLKNKNKCTCYQKLSNSLAEKAERLTLKQIEQIIEKSGL